MPLMLHPPQSLRKSSLLDQGDGSSGRVSAKVGQGDGAKGTVLLAGFLPRGQFSWPGFGQKDGYPG